MKTKECKYKDQEGDRILPISQFRKHKKSKDGLSSQCKTCADMVNRRYTDKNPKLVLERKRVRRQKLLERYREWKSDIGCKCCPETEAICLELHHLIPEEKEVNPADMIRRGWAWERIMEEAEKCVVVCSNCHKKVHAGIINLDDYE